MAGAEGGVLAMSNAAATGDAWGETGARRGLTLLVMQRLMAACVSADTGVAGARPGVAARPAG